MFECQRKRTLHRWHSGSHILCCRHGDNIELQRRNRKWKNQYHEICRKKMTRENAILRHHASNLYTSRCAAHIANGRQPRTTTTKFVGRSAEGKYHPICHKKILFIRCCWNIASRNINSNLCTRFFDVIVSGSTETGIPYLAELVPLPMEPSISATSAHTIVFWDCNMFYDDLQPTEERCWCECTGKRYYSIKYEWNRVLPVQPRSDLYRKGKTEAQNISEMIWWISFRGQ